MSVNYLVKIKVKSLNIRQKASFTSKVVGKVKKGDIYTIVKESNGLGKLKSGVGWISLGSTYVEKYKSASSSNQQTTSSKYVYDFGKCVITNYYGGDKLGSGTKGSLGTELVPNYSCASHNLPYGTIIYIPELKGKVNKSGMFEVQDTGGYGFDFDIFVSKDKSNLVGKKSMDVKVLKWGTNKKLTTSYTYICNYFYKKSQQTGINYLKKYHAAWVSYKDMGGKLIKFYKFNSEDKNITNQKWYKLL